MNKPSYKPKCPNHHVELEECGFPLPAKGTGKCPVSGADFDFEVDIDEFEMVRDKDGNMTKRPKWSLSGEEV